MRELTPSDNSAPAPWLGSPSATTETGEQSWALVQSNTPLLYLQYRFAARDHWRCMTHILRRQWKIALSYLAFSLVFAGSVFYYTRLLFIAHAHRPPLISPTTMVIDLAIPLMVPLFMWSFLLAAQCLGAKQQIITLQVTPFQFWWYSSITTNLPSPKIPWSDFTVVEIKNGDIYLMGRVRFRNTRWMYIPSTAFVDRDAAQRFYGSVESIWKAQGASPIVPDGIRTEFLPPETTV